ncbi:MAG: hypothetical protein M3P93_09780 [Actinomycetota bacterium]|nr:hypothetical protein [Actinomycetota bacterium]
MARRDGRYPGLPLLVTANDPDNRLSNGDSGVVVERDGELVALFDRGATRTASRSDGWPTSGRCTP